MVSPGVPPPLLSSISNSNGLRVSTHAAVEKDEKSMKLEERDSRNLSEWLGLCLPLTFTA